MGVILFFLMDAFEAFSNVVVVVAFSGDDTFFERKCQDILCGACRNDGNLISIKEKK